MAANKAMRTVLHAIAAVAWCVYTQGHVMAEKADREKPIKLEADRVTVDDAKQVSTFVGGVVLMQGSLLIRGDRMEVRQDSEGFKHGTTWGNPAYFKQKRDGTDDYIEGQAARIEYDGRADTVQFFTEATLKKGGDEVRGNYISYDAKSEFFQVVGGKPQSGPSGTDGRVHAVIQPKPKTPAAPANSPATTSGALQNSPPPTQR